MSMSSIDKTVSERQNKLIKFSLIFLGFIFVAIGIVGIIIPGLPTTIFLIIAASCFAKSSPCLHSWLMSHKWFGPIIYHWNETRSIPAKAKRTALVMMSVAALYSGYSIDLIFVKLGVLLLISISAIYVYRLPLSQPETNDALKKAINNR